LANKRENEEDIKYMVNYANAKSRIKEETGRKCEAMSFGTNFNMKEFYYSKTKRENKFAKLARNNFESSEESSIDPDTYSEETSEEDDALTEKAKTDKGSESEYESEESKLPEPEVKPKKVRP